MWYCLCCAPILVCRHHRNFRWPHWNTEISYLRNQGGLSLRKLCQKSYLTSGRSSFGRITWKRLQQPMVPSCHTAWHSESNFILKAVDSISNESPYLALQDAHAFYWVHYLIREEFQSAGQSMQQQFAVDWTIMRHLQGHPELNLNLLAKIDSSNESPYKALQYSCPHFYLSLSRSSRKKYQKARSVVSTCT